MKQIGQHKPGHSAATQEPHTHTPLTPKFKSDNPRQIVKGEENATWKCKLNVNVKKKVLTENSVEDTGWMSPARTTAVQYPQLYSRFYIDPVRAVVRSPSSCMQISWGRMQEKDAVLRSLGCPWYVPLWYRLEWHLFRVTFNTCGCIKSDSMGHKLNGDAQGKNDL